jgi:tetratricopeptide (TPR) repeat protein
MKEYFFWKVWSLSERRTTITALVLILLALLFFVFNSIDPLSNVIQWNVLSEVAEIPTVVDILRIDQWQYGVSVPSQLVTESFIASVMETDLRMVGIFWIFALAGLSFLLASLTTLPRFWYLAGMILFILLLAFSRLEALGVFGEGNKTLFLLTAILYGGASYYFHAFRQDIGMSIRVLSMVGISALLSVLIISASPLPYSGLAAAAYSMPFWLLLSIVFLLVISTEIMALFVWISTTGSGKKGKPGLVNFLVISILYLLMLTLQYLRNTKQIDWNLTLIGPAYLALIAAIAGIWGFKKRANSTDGLMPFRSAGFWFYAGLFIITLSFTAFVTGTANDPILEVLEDVVVQGQLGMSLLFFFYILVNFYPLFKQGLEVHKVLYKPLRFGLTQTRLFGVVAVFVLFSIQRLLPLNQGIAGYFNGLGDLYSHTGEFTLAEQYYKMALQQEFQNHKSNYALASLALRQGDNNAAAYYFRQALLKNPSAQAYAGLGSILVQENLFFDAVHSLQEGLRAFPESGELLNNLGMLYSKTNVADSAYYYLEKAERNTSRNDIPATNLLAIFAKNTDPRLLDSLTQKSDERAYISWQANWLAVQNLRQDFSKRSFSSKAIPADSLLSVSSFAYLQNYALNQARTDSMPARLLPKLAIKNPLLSQDLSFAAFYPEFYSGNKLKSIETISAWAAEDGDKKNLYEKVVGHWLLQLGLYEKAIEHLSLVEGIEGTLGVAVANALSGNEAVAGILLEKIQEKEPVAAIDQLRKTLFSGIKPKMKADSLFQVAKKSPSDRNFDLAVHENPFSGTIVSATADWYRQKKQTAKAYNMVITALRFNDYSPELWEQYTYLSLDQGLTEQADAGEAKVQQYALPAGYQQFMNRYQPIRALIEKQRAEFK